MTEQRRSIIGLCAIAGLALATATGARPAGAQDTTYIGGSGQRNVVVNLDAIEGGRAPTRSGADDAPGFGEPIAGPGGSVLRFPPKDTPRSRLTLSLPESGAGDAQAAADTRRRTPSKPTEKPAAPRQTATAQDQARQTTPPAPDQRPARAAGGDAESTRTAAAEPEAGTATPPAPSEPAEPRVPAAPSETAAAPQEEETGTRTPTAETQTAETASPPAPEQDDGSAAATEGEETQTAALPPADEALPKELRLRFEGDSAALSEDGRALLNRLARRMKENPQARIQLLAYAEGTEDTASQARRLSLSRALAVRSFLIDQGVRSTRMDVRALGGTAESGPPNRVDIVPAKR